LEPHVKYSDARGRIRSGDLIAQSHRGWGSFHDFKVQMVRAFTQSEYSHAATAWTIGNRVFVIEAVMPLVRIYPLSKLGEFYWIPLQAAWSPQTEALALDKVGQPYSQLDAIEAFFRLPNADGKWECAELARAIALSDGINLGDTATPTAVVKAAQQRPGAQTFLVEPD
jgi:hypothetical protein